MVKTRNGKVTDNSPLPKKSKKMRRTWTHLYIDNKSPTNISTKRKDKYDIPNNSYPFIIVPGTKIYLACVERHSAKWYNLGGITKYWINNVFLTKDEAEDWINNYQCGEDKWIEQSKIIETTLQS
jgi:hypothetical protein